EQPKQQHGEQRDPNQARGILRIVKSNFFRQQLGDGTAQAKVKEAEITNQDPCQGQDSVAIDSKLMDENRYRENRQQQGRDLAGEIPQAIQCHAFSERWRRGFGVNSRATHLVNSRQTTASAAAKAGSPACLCAASQ